MKIAAPSGAVFDCAECPVMADSRRLGFLRGVLSVHAGRSGFPYSGRSW